MLLRMEDQLSRSQSVDNGLTRFLAAERKGQGVDESEGKGEPRRMTAPETRAQDTNSQPSVAYTQGQMPLAGESRQSPAWLDASPNSSSLHATQSWPGCAPSGKHALGGSDVSSTETSRGVKRMSEDSKPGDKLADGPSTPMATPSATVQQLNSDTHSNESAAPRQPLRSSPAMPMSQRPFASHPAGPPPGTFSYPPRPQYITQPMGMPHFANHPPNGQGPAFVYRMSPHPHTFPARTMSYPDTRHGSAPGYHGYSYPAAPPHYPHQAAHQWSYPAAPVEHENPLDVFAAIAMAQAESSDRDRKCDGSDAPHDSGIGSSPTHHSRRHSSIDRGHSHSMSDSTEDMAVASSGTRDSQRTSPDCFGSPAGDAHVIDGVKLLSQAAMVEGARHFKQEGAGASAPVGYPTSWQPTPVPSGLQSPVVPSTPTLGQSQKSGKTPRMSRKNSSASNLSDKGSAPSENRRERNKEAAQLCRQRKKNYMQSIEEQASGLVNEKLTLSARVASLTAQRKQAQVLHQAIMQCNSSLMDELRKLVAKCRESLPAELHEKVNAIEREASLDYRDVACDREVPKFASAGFGYARSADPDTDGGEDASHVASDAGGALYGLKMSWESLHVHSTACVNGMPCDSRPNARLICAGEL